MPRLELVLLAPLGDIGHGISAALRHSEKMVAILNEDEEQPESIRGCSGQDPLTVEQFIADTDAWCERNSALSYAVVSFDDCIGMISMSHIDYEKKSARCGWILASEYWGRDFEVDAVRQIIGIARERGLKTIGGKVRGPSSAAADIWQMLGARFEATDRPTHRLAVLDIEPDSNAVGH